ncbi:winged helix-turn-helix transcriptional regulator [Streptomyces hainanensis]|uniref:Transcriptional regulator n=1 Tax=Streptomyces hainanensis TaxID=402648 RepID=A0A4V6PBF3_9ACTN|nr:helix-turn-helix domain-containing protein [Streptomyces hainanensis]TDC62305.1 transcriptional regulator [Streptomyces hainanensis]
MREPLPPDLFEELCPSGVVPIRFADKWAGLVLACLRTGPRRYSELRVPLARVTPRVLTRSLRNLERDGLVTRTVSRRPPGVEYELTPLGRSLTEVYATVCGWAAQHWDELLDARERYDAAHPEATAG